MIKLNKQHVYFIILQVRTGLYFFFLQKYQISWKPLDLRLYVFSYSTISYSIHNRHVTVEHVDG